MPCDLLIIGGGLSGLAAARRARQAGLTVRLWASTRGSLPFTSGALDLLGVYPAETKRFRQNPWEALGELMEAEPGHPYGLLGPARVRECWEEFTTYLGEGPLAYHSRGEENLLVPTAVGTLKPTHAVPGSMRAGVLAWAHRLPTLILGFAGLTDFSPEQVVGNLSERWPGLRAARIPVPAPFPDGVRLTPMTLCAQFEKPEFREAFVEAVRPLLGDARVVGLPAVLGHGDVSAICSHLEQKLGVEVFEFPLLTPSIPGMRLSSLLRGDLQRAGVRLEPGLEAVALHGDGPGGRLTTVVGRSREGLLLEARPELGVVLATGRFLGGGLVADRQGLYVPLLDQRLEAPRNRDDWHMATFLGAPGHPLNRLGLAVDEALRPLSSEGRPCYANLRAAGAILKGQDWVREKSGAGLSVVTGYSAVDLFLDG